MTQLYVYFDGSCGPTNPGGTAAYGFLVKDVAGDTVYSSSGRVGTGPDMTCNIGEYEAVYQAMLWVQEHYPLAQAVFYGDSTLVVNQINGDSKARKGKYLPFYHKTILLASPYIESGQWRCQWINRAMNSEADNLAQYQRYALDPVIIPEGQGDLNHA